MALRRDGRPWPGLAVAKQEGQYVGKLVRARLDGSRPPPAFRYRDYGTMATIGRSAAVADLRGLKPTGIVAWLLWGALHIYYLIGFRNRLVVLVNWFWVWLIYARGARLMISDIRGAPISIGRAGATDRDQAQALHREISIDEALGTGPVDWLL